MDPRRSYLPQGAPGVGPGSLGESKGQAYMRYQEPYQAQHKHQNQAQELQNRRLPHPLDPPLPGLGILPHLVELSREQQQQQQQRQEINIYPRQAPPPQQYLGENVTGHRKISSWPQGVELQKLPPKNINGKRHRDTHAQHTEPEHNHIRIDSKEIEQDQPPARKSGRQPRQLNLTSYSSVAPFQRSSQVESMGNYPMHEIRHHGGYVNQGKSWTGPRQTPVTETRSNWTPNHMRSQSDEIYRLRGDRHLEDARGPPCYDEAMHNVGLQKTSGLKKNMQPAQPANGALALQLQPYLATTGPWGNSGGYAPSVPEPTLMKTREWHTNHAMSWMQSSNTMSHQSITHANPTMQGSNGMLPQGHVYESVRSTPTPVSPTAVAAIRNGTYKDPLLMLLRAAELILGPLIPKGMSSNAKEAGGEKLTASQNVLPLPNRPSLSYAMRTRDHPNAHADARLSLPGLVNPRGDIEALRLPALREALQSVNLYSADSDLSSNDQHQEEAPNPQTVGQPGSKCRSHQNGFASVTDRVQSDMSSSDISQFSIIKKRKLENCTGQAAGQDAGLERVRYLYEKPFNIFQEILKRPELTLFLAKHLRVQELLILYHTSRNFHNMVNTRFTTIIRAQAQARAPQSAKIFPPRCYAKLCILDPGLRPHPVARRAAVGETRKVPSFRWLLMVCFREMVCHEIITILAEDGVPVPDRCASTIKKIWLLLDIPDNARRIGLVQNREIFTDVDLFFATLFFVKLDMRFTDPITGSGKDGMRRLLLAQPSLSMLWRTLKRTALTSKLDVMRLFARWKYQPRQDQRGLSMFGIPAHEVGIVQYQGWGRTGNRTALQRPDELLLKESIRRGLELQQRYTDMFLWGYINPNTMRDYPSVVRRRRLERLEGLEEMLVPVEDRGKVEVGKVVSRRVRG
ncbi:hypothetical protein EMCG_07944 [[Emmonsia] crescens]|uniref:Uncharacterized protein n=1 Tax=[Emmonsia] crescens TaxID=73230 RepID=A0A0G2I776_9EURO|nr:hypothetical protein EMCG_07944 [Emmonsia crescens UAMH 3008]